MSRRLDRAVQRLGYTTYAEYLGSKHWRAIKAAYNRQYGRRCRAFGCRRPYTDLHHPPAAYRKLGRERPSDLRGLCRRHHRRAHGRRAMVPGWALVAALGAAWWMEAHGGITAVLRLLENL